MTCREGFTLPAEILAHVAEYGLDFFSPPEIFLVHSFALSS